MPFETVDFNGRARLIPDHLQMQLTQYFRNHIRPCSFVEAILSNDLYGSLRRADEENRAHIPLLVEFIYETGRLPSEAVGSEQAVSAWLAQWLGQ